MRSSTCSLDGFFYVLLMKNNKDQEMTKTLTPFQIFVSLIYEQDSPIILIPAVMQHDGIKEDVQIIFALKELNWRQRLWDRSWVTSHFKCNITNTSWSVYERFLDIAIKHCVIHLLLLTIIVSLFLFLQI